MASKGALFIMVLLLLFGTGSNPKGERVEKDVKVCEKETATLVCGTDGHEASYRWKFASRKRVPKKTDKYEQLQNGAILLVKNVTHSDIAKIKYISCHTHGDDLRRITYLYKIAINCVNFESPVGSSVRLPCKVDIQDDELDYIRWTFIFKRHSKTERIKLFKRDGKATVATSLKFNGRISVQNRNLLIQNLKMEDVGAYHCVAYRKKNFHLSNPNYYYNVNVTARTTTKPILVNTTTSTKTITLGPSIGYTVEPAKTVTPNTSSLTPNTSSQPKFTTPSITPTISTRKTVNISTGSMQASTTPTTFSKTRSTQSPVVQTNIRSTVSSTWTAMPTSASLPNTELNKGFTTKSKVLLPTTSGTTNLNQTQKHDDRTPNGSSRSSPSNLLLLFLLFNLVNSQLNYAST